MAQSRTTAGIEITPQEIHVVVVQRGVTGPRVLGAESFRWESSQLRQAGRQIKAYLRGFGRRLSVRCCLSSPSAFIRLLELPSVDSVTLGQMIPFELERHIPFPADQAVIGHCILGTSVTAMTRALVAGLKAEDAETLRQLIESACPRQASCTLTSLAEAALADGTDELGSTKSGVVIADLRPSDSIITVYDGADGFLSRSTGSIPADRLTNEIKRTVSGFHSSFPGSRVRRWIVGGESAGQVLSRMGTELDPSVELADPWQGFQLPQADGVDPHRYFAATAAAVTDEKSRLTMDLLKEERKKPASAGKRGTGWLAAVLLVFALTVGGSLWSWRTQLSVKEAELARVERQVQRLRKTTPSKTTPGLSITDTQAIETLARDSRRSSFTWLEILRALSVRLPSGVYLTEMNCDKDKEVVFTGSAPTNEEIAATVRILEKTELLSEVRLVYTRIAPKAKPSRRRSERADASEGKESCEFQISCSLGAKKQGGRR